MVSTYSSARMAAATSRLSSRSGIIFWDVERGKSALHHIDARMRVSNARRRDAILDSFFFECPAMQIRLLLAAALTFGASLDAPSAIAQAWKPARGIEIIVGSAPGGGADLTGRLMQKLFQEKLITDVASSVVNKTGGGSTLSFVYLNQHPGDGHYIALTLQPMITGPLMIAGQIPYTDMTPLAHLINEYVGFAVRPDGTLKSGRDIVERLKKDPTSLTIALSTALAGSNHLATVLALKAAGVDIKRLRVIVVKGAGDAITGVMGGHYDLAAASAASLIPFVESGKLH